MTETSFSAAVWCILQVSLVSLIGVVMSLRIASRRPAATLSGVCTAALVCVLLTLLAPLSVHHLFVVEARKAGDEITRPRGSAAVSRRLPDAAKPRMDQPVPLFDLQELTHAIRAMARTVELSEPRNSLVPAGVISILMAFCGLGLTRWIAGVAFVSKLLRTSVPITDPHLLSLYQEVSRALGHQNICEIDEHRDFTDAAVAGWFHPRVILPYEWREWTDDERRAVLAHESAHLIRHDALWRSLASGLLALHFYNPLVHWLMRRIILCQELSADSFAASRIGQKLYLKSLSSLALRRDNQFGKFKSVNVLPVFSGHLIGRIHALNSMEGITEMRSKHGRNLRAGMISAAFIGLGIGLLAARGIAQQPPESPPGKTDPVRTASLTKDRSESAIAEDPTNGMFHRTPLDPSVVDLNNRFGMFALRVNELLEYPELKSYLPLLNASLSAALTTELKLKTPPVIACETIEWIAARPVMTIRAKTKDQKGMLMFGAGGCLIKLRQPLNLSQWVEQYAPETKRHIIEGKDVFEIRIGAMGPQAIKVWMPDEFTIVASGASPKLELSSNSKLSDLNLDPQSSPSHRAEPGPDASDNEGFELAWSNTWNRIDRGLLSAVLARFDTSGLLAEMDNHPDFQTDAGIAIAAPVRAILKRSSTPAVSLDLAQGSTKFGMRVSLSHLSREEAVKSEKDLETVLMIAKKEIRNEIESENEGEPSADKNDLRLFDALLQSASISVSNFEDGTANVVISTAVPIAKLIESLSTGISYEEVNAENPPKGTEPVAKEPSKTERR